MVLEPQCLSHKWRCWWWWWLVLVLVARVVIVLVVMLVTVMVLIGSMRGTATSIA